MPRSKRAIARTTAPPATIGRQKIHTVVMTDTTTAHARIAAARTTPSHAAIHMPVKTAMEAVPSAANPKPINAVG
ncbi:hypothetical protein GCM10023087_13510 [Microbacterium rhizosphaerae]